MKSLLSIASILSILSMSAAAQPATTNSAGQVSIAAMPPIPPTVASNIAQSIPTNTIPPSIISQTLSWITTPDTGNRALETYPWRLEMGPSTQSGVTVSDDLFLQHNQSNHISEVARFRNLGVGGTMLDAAGGGGYTIQWYDREITPYVMGGYRFDQSKPLVSIGADFRIMIGNNMFTGLDAGVDIARKMGVRVRLTVIGIAF